MGRPTASSSRGRTSSRRPEHSKFTTFVDNVLTRAEVTMSTVLATLVYIDRSKPHLHIGLEQWALERVFLGALIVASKVRPSKCTFLRKPSDPAFFQYLNDSTLKNVHWALCTGVFGKRDVGRIEREYLDVLNFELKITEDDLLSHHQGLSEVVSELALPLPASPAHSERRHTRRRDMLAVPNMRVPELSPSGHASSESDSDSSFSSPRTPASMDTSPEEAPRAPTKATFRGHNHHHHHHAAPQPTAARKMINAVAQASTMEVRRLFPIPRMTTS